jgi:hypothetical protein
MEDALYSVHEVKQIMFICGMKVLDTIEYSIGKYITYEVEKDWEMI